jgi:hypothetical protein
MLLYVFQVLYHAHAVRSAAAFVESLQSVVGEILAMIVESHQPFSQ